MFQRVWKTIKLKAWCQWPRIFMTLFLQPPSSHGGRFSSGSRGNIHNNCRHVRESKSLWLVCNLSPSFRIWKCSARHMSKPTAYTFYLCVSVSIFHGILQPRLSFVSNGMSKTRTIKILIQQPTVFFCIKYGTTFVPFPKIVYHKEQSVIRIQGGKGLRRPVPHANIFYNLHCT